MCSHWSGRCRANLLQLVLCCAPLGRQQGSLLLSRKCTLSALSGPAEKDQMIFMNSSRYKELESDDEKEGHQNSCSTFAGPHVVLINKWFLRDGCGGSNQHPTLGKYPTIELYSKSCPRILNFKILMAEHERIGLGEVAQTLIILTAGTAAQCWGSEGKRAWKQSLFCYCLSPYTFFCTTLPA